MGHAVFVTLEELFVAPNINKVNRGKLSLETFCSEN